MKRIFLALLFMAAACETVPDPVATETAVSRAVAAEGVTAARCSLGQPSASEWQLVTTARLLFMSTFGPQMSDDQLHRYDLAVDRTNEVCRSVP